MKRLLILLLMLPGCTRSDPEKERADSERARDALAQALDAWRSGRPPAPGHDQQAPQFFDDHKSAGWQLVAYELLQPDQTIKPFEAVPVRLTLRDRQGRSLEITANYHVTLSPAVAVLRAD